MSSVPVKQGDPIPLHHQIKSHETGRYVRAVIKDDAGVSYATQALTDVGEGLYVSKAQTMPGKNLIATYQTSDDALFSNITDWEAGLDIFVLDTFAELTRKDHFVGVLEDLGLAVGVAPANAILAEVYEEFIEGVLPANNKIIGEMPGNEIIGKVGCAI